jgi:DNA-binding transcriptional LysR family regulator
MDDWNEPRLVLAVQRTGTLTGAAKSLGIDHSTAFRRLNALEERLAVRLFERLPGGVYLPTSAGERMATAAERMEDEALALDRDIAGRDHRLSGRLRVTCSETLAYRLLTRHLAVFRREHPGIVVELVIDNRVLSLPRRESDIALRPTRPKQGDLWGRKLAGVAWGVYGARALLQSTQTPILVAEDLSAHAVIGWGEGTASIAAADWLSRTVRAEAFVYRANSMVNQMLAARAGIGLAVLPCFLGDAEPDLARALPQPVPELMGELWIVTHADLKDTARVRVFFDLVGGGLIGERDLIEGRIEHAATAAMT